VCDSLSDFSVCKNLKDKRRLLQGLKEVTLLWRQLTDNGGVISIRSSVWHISSAKSLNEFWLSLARKVYTVTFPSEMISSKSILWTTSLHESQITLYTFLRKRLMIPKQLVNFITCCSLSAETFARIFYGLNYIYTEIQIQASTMRLVFYLYPWWALSTIGLFLQWIAIKTNERTVKIITKRIILMLRTLFHADYSNTNLNI